MTHTTGQAAHEEMRLYQFDPADLLMDANVRGDAEASVDAGFVAAIKATRGNLEPVGLVRVPGGGLRVRFGHRRVIACARAKVKVTGFVLGDEGESQEDRRRRIVEQLHENDHRRPLTVADRAAAVLALFDAEGMTVAGIAKAAAIGKDEVAAALAVARSELAVKATERWDFLDLEQAAVLAEFDGDAEALTELARAASDTPGKFGHVAAQLRASREARAAKAAFTAPLEQAGFQVRERYAPWDQRLERLRDAGGNPITPEAHEGCPGRGVVVDTEDVWPDEAQAAYRAAHGLDPDEEIEFGTDEEARAAGFTEMWRVTGHYCADPGKHGHRNPATPASRGSAGTPPAGESGEERASREAREKAAKTEEIRRVRQGNIAWRAATTVRVKHLGTLAGRKSLSRALADAAVLLIAQAIARAETQPEKTGEGHELACALLGLPGSGPGRDRILTALDQASPARRLVISLVAVLAAAEGEDGTWGACADVHTWQRAWDSNGLPRQDYGNRGFHSGPGRAARYLAWLEKHTGYVLSDLEALAAHGTRPPGTAEDAAGLAPAGPGPSADGGEEPAPPSGCRVRAECGHVHVLPAAAAAGDMVDCADGSCHGQRAVTEILDMAVIDAPEPGGLPAEPAVAEVPRLLGQEPAGGEGMQAEDLPAGYAGDDAESTAR